MDDESAGVTFQVIDINNPNVAGSEAASKELAMLSAKNVERWPDTIFGLFRIEQTDRRPRSVLVEAETEAKRWPIGR